MDDIYDTFHWEDMEMFGDMLEEFSDDEMEFLRTKKDNDVLKNDHLDAFSSDDLEI